MAKQIVPSAVLSPTVQQGLNATYYKYNGNGQFGDVIYSSASPNIDYTWGSAAPNSFVPKDRYGVVWTGKLTAPATGDYTFATQSDDGVRLWVDDKNVIDAWTDHSSRRDTGTVRLNAGQTYAIKLSYYENYGDAVIRLFWKVPGQAEAIVPSGVLRQN